MLRDLRFLFDDQQLYARMGLENLHRGGETDNAGADNREIVLGCHGSTAEVQKPRHLSPATGINLRPPFDKLRVNGTRQDAVGNFPFVLGLSKHRTFFEQPARCAAVCASFSQ